MSNIIALKQITIHWTFRYYHVLHVRRTQLSLLHSKQLGLTSNVNLEHLFGARYQKQTFYSLRPNVVVPGKSTFNDTTRGHCPHTAVNNELCSHFSLFTQTYLGRLGKRETIVRSGRQFSEYSCQLGVLGTSCSFFPNLNGPCPSAHKWSTYRTFCWIDPCRARAEWEYYILCTWVWGKRWPFRTPQHDKWNFFRPKEKGTRSKYPSFEGLGVTPGSTTGWHLPFILEILSTHNWVRISNGTKLEQSNLC